MPARAALSAICLAAVLGTASAGDGPALASLGVDPSALPVAVEGFEMIRGEVHRDGRVYIAGQPSEGALARFKELGVTAVVNLRTPREMESRDQVPFDEAAAVADLGLEYVAIPLGGDDHPYTPEAVERFAAVLERHRGPVLLHCTVAWRASYLWTAYLVRSLGVELADALARGEAIAISPSPLEGLLDLPLTLVPESPAREPEPTPAP